MSLATSYNGSRLNDRASRESNTIKPRVLDTPPDSIGHIREMSQLKHYEVIEKLGQGTFGVVQKAKRKSDGAIVAIKQLLNHSAKEGFPITAMREITILKRLSHNNILSILDMIFEEAKVSNNAEIVQNRGSFYTVSPYMSSDLVGLLENPNIKLELNQIKCIMQQLFTGIQYIHDNNYLHRDIKAANILIDQFGVLKIADFGLARVYHGSAPRLGMGPGGGEKSYTGLVVTRWYRPPEILLGERKYTTAVDIWGIGCVFAELFTGKPILVGKTDADQAKIVFELLGSPLTWADAAKLPHKTEYNSGLACTRTLESRFEKIMPIDAIKLLGGLLTLDPYKRFNALDALNHDFFKNEPIPLLPSQMPKFEESHEIDKERYKKMKDRSYPVSELKPPTEIQYDNHSEFHQDTVHSSFGGDRDRDNRYASGKSEYNYAGKLRYEQYGHKSQYDSGKLRHEQYGHKPQHDSGRLRHDQYDSYIPKAPAGDHRPDHPDHRGRNDYYDRGDYYDNPRLDRDRYDRWETRDNNSRDAPPKDLYVPSSTVSKIREVGETYLGKYDSYRKYGDRSRTESASKAVPSLPPKPSVASSLVSRSSFAPKVSSANAIKVSPREDKRVKVGSISVKEPGRDPMVSEKENVESKDEGKNVDQEPKSPNGKLSPKRPAGPRALETAQKLTPDTKVAPPKSIDAAKKEEAVKKEEAEKTEELVKKDEPSESIVDKSAEPLKKSGSLKKSDSTQSEPARTVTPVKKPESVKSSWGSEPMKNTKVGSISLAIPKARRATAAAAAAALASLRDKSASPGPSSRIAKRRLEALDPPVPVKRAREKSSNDSESELSDVDQDADLKGENETVFKDFVNKESLMKDGFWTLLMREKMLYNRYSQGKK
ncbi:Serine/threonine-protein kinase BUR1 [Candida viswanathii]|uniref:Serine/threonine-protein kinase BUR1 n=1 Tax=Candida viswanathii TaxID=5486 RepID=A0A367XL29_9ASCO|nr:Serine/threonine-protein kinase BUR1 [Candida viswanathii]